MAASSIARTALRIPYSLARAPLSVLDMYLLRRLPDSSRVRVTFTRGLAGLDAAAGRLVGDPQLERRGDAASEQIDATERADQAAAKADALRADAKQAKQAGANEAKSRRKKAAQEERERIADALREENEATLHVGELAEADLKEQERQAELRAKHQQAEQAEQGRAKQRRIEAAKARSTAPAKTQLKSASTTKATARSRSANADKLGELAKTEKANRRAGTKRTTAR